MAAYQVLGDSASLDLLRAEEKKQKSHRCVVDASDGMLKIKANIPQTEKQIADAKVLETRREMAKVMDARDEVTGEERKSEIRRRLKLRKKRRVESAKEDEDGSDLEADLEEILEEALASGK